jgi:hypothetical protein
VGDTRQNCPIFAVPQLAGTTSVLDTPYLDTFGRASITDPFLPLVWDKGHNPSWIGAFQGYEDGGARNFPGHVTENCNPPRPANLQPNQKDAKTSQPWTPLFCSRKVFVKWDGNGIGPSPDAPEEGPAMLTGGSQTDYSVGGGKRTYDPRLRTWYKDMKQFLGSTRYSQNGDGSFQFGKEYSSVYADYAGRGYMMSVGTQVSDSNGNIRSRMQCFDNLYIWCRI